MEQTKVISVGGSIISPDKPDSAFLTKFVRMTTAWLHANDSRRLILVAGGGAPARVYQTAYREVSSHKGILAVSMGGDTKETENAAADWIGVMATRLNAELLRACFGELAPESVITNPNEAPSEFQGRVLIAAGWKPGFSTDTDAVFLAEKYGAKMVLNLSNIERVYDDDPKKNPNAKPLDKITWNDFRAMVGSEWNPGMNAPFDPIASKRAAELGLIVICADGHNIENTRAILNGEPFIGTTIGD